MPFIRYVAVTPETVEVIKTGKYPALLPSYLTFKTDFFYVKESAADCVLGIHNNLHQIFVLELELPENSNPKVLKPEWIRSIFVFSQRGHALLSNLFGGVCPKPIIIRPDIYSLVSSGATQTLSVEIPIQTQNMPPIDVRFTNTTPQPKKIRTEETTTSKPAVIFSGSKNLSNVQYNSSSTGRTGTIPKMHASSVTQESAFTASVSQVSSVKRSFYDLTVGSYPTQDLKVNNEASSAATYPQVPTLTLNYESSIENRRPENEMCNVELIYGDNHFQLLTSLINSAQDEILITTKTIGYIPEDIIDSLKSARCRGVAIRVYSIEVPSEWVCDFFEEEGIVFKLLNIHGKHLIVDRSCAVIGSYNWLSFSDEEVNVDDCSIKISNNDDYIRKLRGCIYFTLINYEKISCAKGNNEPLPPIEPKRAPLFLSLKNSSRMLLLTTFQQHVDYLKFICKAAEKSIEIYSPFITAQNAFKRLDLIAKEMKKDVKLHIFLNEYNLIDGARNEFDSISKFIMDHPKLKGKTTITPLDGFHRKTLIVDNETRSEGSFNWLSSAGSIESDFHNQETSIVVQGPILQDLVQSNRHVLRKS